MTSLVWVNAWLLTALLADTATIAVQPLDDRASFAIIDACNRALGAPRCVLLAPAGEPSTLVRVALSSPTVERAAIAFDENGTLTPARILEFEDTDPLEERYRAIGLVIASRLLEAEAAARNTPPPKRSTAPPPRPPPKPNRFGLETALFLGQGLDAGDLRWGLRSRALVRLLEDVPLSALMSVRLGMSASDDDEPSLRWTSLGLGVQGAVPLVRDALLLELHAEGALQLVNASIKDPTSGAEDDGSVTRYGPIAGAQLAWTPFRFWALFIGAESGFMWPPLILEVRRAEVAKEDPIRISAHFGQRLSF